MNTSATETPPVFYSQLAERLVREQLLTSASAREVAQQARSNRITLVQELINGELVDSYHLAALVSEESGTLDEMLGKVADQYEAQVDNAVESMSSLIEPMIMSVLGVLVGGLMITMYLPIFMLGSVI